VPRPRLITGAPAALECALAREVRAAKAGDPLAPVTVLVGGTLLRPYLSRRLVELMGGHLGVSFVTPAELGLLLGERALAGAGRRPLRPLGERVLVEMVAAEASGHFGPVAGTPGFAAALGRLFRELRQAGLSAAQVSRAMARGRSQKQRDLAELFARVEERRAGFYGADDALRHADPERLGSSALILSGLWQPPGALREVLGAVAERRPLVSLLPALGEAADAGQADARRWLVEELGAAVEELDAERSEPASTEAGGGRAPAQSPGGSEMLGRLRRGLVAPSPPLTGAGLADPDGSVRLLSAPDPAREARAAVRACLGWAREGIAFHDMAVIYRQSEPYRGLLDGVLRESGIPFYPHEGAPLIERPLGRRAVTLLDLIDGGLERAALMRFLADARLPDSTWERYGRVAAARWDALSRRAGVVRGLNQWTERLARLRLAERRRSEELEESPERRAERLHDVDALTAFVADLDGRLRARPETAPPSTHLRYLRSLLEAYVEDADPLLDALEEVSELDEVADEMSFDRFRDIVVDLVSSLRSADVLRAPPGAFARRGVAVLDASSARGLRFRAVAVVGLSDRAFPPPPRQDPLLLDEERRALAEAHGWRVPLRAGGADPEPLAFALAVHAAEERLQLSYARTDGQAGRPQYPSVFFRDAAAALSGRRVPVEEVRGLDGELYEHLPAGRLGAPRLDRALTPAEYDRTLLEADRPLGAALLSVRVPSLRRALEADRARHVERHLSAYDGVLGAGTRAALEERAGLGGSLSPTSLETYATCPYRYFLSRVLGLGREEEPEELERLEPMERGTLVHRVLERFLSELGDADRPRLERRIDHLARLEAIGREECDAREARGLTGHPVLWRADREAIFDDLRTWYEEELLDLAGARLDCGAFELRFGPPRPGEEATSPRSVDEPVQVALEGATLRFHGRVDRVNWRTDPPAFRVIDYKTGRRDDRIHRDEQFVGGRALQLPIYLLGAAHALGLPAEAGEAQYYYSSARGGFGRIRFSGETLRARRTELEGLLTGMAEGIRTGDFHLEPSTEKCRYCDFKAHCPADREAVRARKAEDPRALAYVARAEVE